MDSFQKKILDLVIDYQENKYNYKFTYEDLLKYPWHKIVGLYWDVLNETEKDWVKDLSEIEEPVESMIVHIRTSNGVNRYKYKRGNWTYIGNMTEDMYKD